MASSVALHLNLQLQQQEFEECLMCEGDNLNCVVALLWAGNQGERAGVVTVPASAVCVCVCLF